MCMSEKHAIKKAIFLAGRSCYVGIPPSIVKEMSIDDTTYFEVHAENGQLLLKPRRLAP